MPTINTMSLEEVEAALAQLRTRRKTLKSSRTVAQRKIAVLARRRERLFQQIHGLEEQIQQLRAEVGNASAPSASTPRRRGRSPKSAFMG